MSRFLIKIGNDGAVTDVFQSYGMVLEDMPSVIPLVPKNIYSHSWPDEDGDDEYIPETIRYEAAECDFTFGCSSTDSSNTVFDKLNTFLEWLRSGTFSFYCEYSGIGRQNVRLSELHDDARYSKHTLRRNGVDVTEEVLSFTVTFKINDPKTAVVLSFTENSGGEQEEPAGGEEEI